jgi:hypothetical protein
LDAFFVAHGFGGNSPVPRLIHVAVWWNVALQESLTNIIDTREARAPLYESIMIRKIREWKFGMKGEAYLTLTLRRICQPGLEWEFEACRRESGN